MTKEAVLKTYLNLYTIFNKKPCLIKKLDKVYNRLKNLSTIDKASVLETYADLYDLFDDYPETFNQLNFIYDKLRNL